MIIIKTKHSGGGLEMGMAHEGGRGSALKREGGGGIL